MLRLALLLAALLSVAHARPSSIWDINIDESPAPAPDQGPPLSAHALRDKSKLPYEIAGIGGAYVLCMIIAGVLILIGRRARRRQFYGIRRRMLSPRSPAKMVEQPADSKGSLKSPRSGKFASWINPGSRHKFQPSIHSVSTVDEKIIQQDRVKSEDEMTKLYAAVMVHNQEKEMRSRVTLQEDSEQRPPELQHLRNGDTVDSQSSYSVATTAADEIRGVPDSRASTRKTKVSPISIAPYGHDRADSTFSEQSKPSRISIRGQTISSPINFSHPRSPRSPSSIPEEIPLSPRIYNPGPPPPTPGQASFMAQSINEVPEHAEHESVASILSPPPTPGWQSAAAQARDFERERALRARPPANLPMQNQFANNSAGALPFRQAYPDLQSAPPMQTTFLDRQAHLYNGPRTGVPSTPYSPYQPQTPVTPITPRLATKQDLKKSKKGYSKKYGGGPLSPDDIVSSDAEVWGEPL